MVATRSLFLPSLAAAVAFFGISVAAQEEDCYCGPISMKFDLIPGWADDHLKSPGYTPCLDFYKGDIINGSFGYDAKSYCDDMPLPFFNKNLYVDLYVEGWVVVEKFDIAGSVVLEETKNSSAVFMDSRVEWTGKGFDAVTGAKPTQISINVKVCGTSTDRPKIECQSMPLELTFTNICRDEPSSPVGLNLGFFNFVEFDYDPVSCGFGTPTAPTTEGTAGDPGSPTASPFYLPPATTEDTLSPTGSGIIGGEPSPPGSSGCYCGASQLVFALDFNWISRGVPTPCADWVAANNDGSKGIKAADSFCQDIGMDFFDYTFYTGHFVETYLIREIVSELDFFDLFDTEKSDDVGLLSSGDEIIWESQGATSSRYPTNLEFTMKICASPIASDTDLPECREMVMQLSYTNECGEPIPFVEGLDLGLIQVATFVPSDSCGGSIDAPTPTVPFTELPATQIPDTSTPTVNLEPQTISPTAKEAFPTVTPPLPQCPMVCKRVHATG